MKKQLKQLLENKENLSSMNVSDEDMEKVEAKIKSVRGGMRKCFGVLDAMVEDGGFVQPLTGNPMVKGDDPKYSDYDVDDDGLSVKSCYEFNEVSDEDELSDEDEDDFASEPEA